MKAFGVKVCCIEPGLFRTPLSDPNTVLQQRTRIWEKLNASIKEEYGENYLPIGIFFFSMN